MDRNHLAPSHHGGRSLRSIGWAFKSYGIQSRPQKVLLCANEKLIWNQVDCLCKEWNDSSIPRWLQYVLSRQQVSSAPTKTVRSTSGNQTTCVVCSLGVCAKVTQTNFDEFPGFSWLFEEISLRTKFPRTFEVPIVLVRRNYDCYFAVDASELRTQEGKFAPLVGSVQNFERKFALLITAKCSPSIVVMHCRNIRN